MSAVAPENPRGAEHSFGISFCRIKSPKHDVLCVYLQLVQVLLSLRFITRFFDVELSLLPGFSVHPAGVNVILLPLFTSRFAFRLFVAGKNFSHEAEERVKRSFCSLVQISLGKRREKLVSVNDKLSWNQFELMSSVDEAFA